MDNLRLILIVAGVVLLAGIYVWGVAFAKRRDSRPMEDYPADPLEDDLDGIQDIRAAQNVESLASLGNFDIDQDLDRDMPAGEPLGERRPRASDVESEANEISADGTDEAVRLDGDIDEDIDQDRGDDAGDGGVSAVAGIDFEPDIEGLSGIRATRAADDEVPMGQLDLLRFDDESEQPAPPPEKGSGKRPRREKSADAAQVETTAVAITVMAREGQRFSGADLRRLLQSLHLEHGEMGIFHRRERGKSRRLPPLFSVANVVKPGTFEPDAMAEMTTPGVAMFMQLPGPDDPGAAFEEMIRAARKLAQGLNGVVCDETRSTLTGQVINHMRERISEFNRKQRVRL
jgi:cell division protein ZipA